MIPDDVHRADARLVAQGREREDLLEHPIAIGRPAGLALRGLDGVHPTVGPVPDGVHGAEGPVAERPDHLEVGHEPRERRRGRAAAAVVVVVVVVVVVGGRGGGVPTMVIVADGTLGRGHYESRVVLFYASVRLANEIVVRVVLHF